MKNVECRKPERALVCIERANSLNPQFSLFNWRLAFILLLATAATGLAEPLSKAKKGDWPMWGGSPDRNMVSGETGIPAKWNVKTGENIKWVAPLGSQTYGNPVIHKGKIFVGTNNTGEYRPKIKGDKGVIICVDEKTGKMLWQATHDKLPSGRVNDWPEQGICSSPFAERDRIYYVSNRCDVVCADTEGFLDGENDGPFAEEPNQNKDEADVIWKLDIQQHRFLSENGDAGLQVRRLQVSDHPPLEARA